MDASIDVDDDIDAQVDVDDIDEDVRVHMLMR